MFRQPAALRFLSCYHITVERVKHGRSGSLFRLFFLAEYTEQSFALRFLWILLYALPCDDGNTFGYLFIDSLLIVKQLHYLIQMLFLAFQQIAHSVDALCRIRLLEAAKQAVHFQPFPVIGLHVFILPFKHGFTHQ